MLFFHFFPEAYASLPKVYVMLSCHHTEIEATREIKNDTEKMSRRQPGAAKLNVTLYLKKSRFKTCLFSTHLYFNLDEIMYVATKHI